MGAWIEIYYVTNFKPAHFVAPYMGAWIEIGTAKSASPEKEGRSLHGSVDWNPVGIICVRRDPGRSLHGSVDWNGDGPPLYYETMMSLPTWERGLKSFWNSNGIILYIVAPYMGAWIEISHVCGSADSRWVAPYMGAWIEIVLSGAGSRYLRWSLPTWERGLKFQYFDTIDKNVNVAPYMGAWIEIVEWQRRQAGSLCRSLHGSVDWNISPIKFWIPTLGRSLHGSVDWNNIVSSWIYMFCKSLPTWERGLK